jgi:hypothetical protein
MDGTVLQQKVYYGYAQSALRVGLTYSQYRPTSALDPIAAGNLLQTLPAAFNAEDMKFSKPVVYAKATWFCLVDGRQTQVGDYLVGPELTYFIAAQQALLPILAVLCNRTINLLRPQQLSGTGTVGYGGDTVANEMVLMTGWPASILQGTKGEKGDAELPGDVRNPWWAVLLPDWPGITLRSGDIITDDLTRRYIVSSAELTELGWRLTALQALT